jgi:dGTPase
MSGLAAYAARDETSRGRRFPEEAPAHRSQFQRDRDRIIHCAAFRRLEYKTQVFVNHEGDLFRTRLTHSIEVAQIGRSIARALALNEDLTEAISLAHDLGHTPFGHSGQDALNDCMREHGGFEHNLQSLRVVDVLEERYAAFPGLNLTFESREGILKHCSLKNAAELGDVGRRFTDKTQPSLEAQLANLADEIAYNNHDVDDGLRAGLIGVEALRECALFRDQYDAVMRLHADLKARVQIHETVRRMIGAQVTDVIEASRARVAAAGIRSIDDVRGYREPVIAMSDAMRAHNLELKQFLRRHLYQHYRVRRMMRKGERVIRELFAAFMEDPRLLAPQDAARVSQANGPDARARAIADYIAGMTDRYAIREHRRLFEVAELT